MMDNVLKHKYFVDMPQLQSPMVKYGHLKDAYWEGTQTTFNLKCFIVEVEDMKIIWETIKNRGTPKEIKEFKMILNSWANVRRKDGNV